ncbi:hypothetical protein EDB86DRAFT_2179178 [Lactarius hatsudake]|nr:hypothetical protein EDB86DRAFT_2179178 [Lactarius hatsudake]
MVSLGELCGVLFSIVVQSASRGNTCTELACIPANYLINIPALTTFPHLLSRVRSCGGRRPLLASTPTPLSCPHHPPPASKRLRSSSRARDDPAPPRPLPFPRRALPSPGPHSFLCPSKSRPYLSLPTILVLPLVSLLIPPRCHQLPCTLPAIYATLPFLSALPTPSSQSHVRGDPRCRHFRSTSVSLPALPPPDLVAFSPPSPPSAPPAASHHV